MEDNEWTACLSCMALHSDSIIEQCPIQLTVLTTVEVHNYYGVKYMSYFHKCFIAGRIHIVM